MTIRAIELIANGAPWCITQDMMSTIVAVAERSTTPEAVAAELGRPLDNTRAVTERNGVAIIPISGPIFPKANLMTEISGATSIGVLALDLRKALDNPAIHSVLLDIDSPGGNVVGINEFAGMVRSAEKPITAYVGGMAASAAFWIASAADQIVVEPTAMVGNIGVVTGGFLNKDEDRFEIVSSRAQDKRPDVSTEQGRSIIQAELDALEDVFLETVAAGIGRSVDDIAAHRGRVLIGRQAVDAGFASSLGSFESTLAGLSGATNPRGISMSANNASQTPEITQKFIAENHPDIATAFREEGAQANSADHESALTAARETSATEERERILAVQDQLIPGHEALISTLMFDGKTSGPEAAVQVVNAEKSALGNALDAIKSGSPEAVNQPSTDIEPQESSAESDAPIEERAKAEWDKSAALRTEFASNYDSFLAYKKASEGGKVKVLSK